MTSYSLVLFIHVTAVLLLFAALSFEVLSVVHLRRAATVGEVRQWLDAVPRLPLITFGSLLAAVATGIDLTMRISAFGAAWPNVSSAAIALLGPLSALGAFRMRAIRRLSRQATVVDGELRKRLRDPILKLSAGIRIAVVLGIVLLMGARPGLWESVGVVSVSVMLGVLSTLPRTTASS